MFFSFRSTAVFQLYFHNFIDIKFYSIYGCPNETCRDLLSLHRDYEVISFEYLIKKQGRTAIRPFITKPARSNLIISEFRQVL